MARAYHNLTGLCRDLRAAALAAAEGNQEAIDIVLAFDDALELHDAVVSGDMDGGEDSDAPASGDDAEDESDAPLGGEGGRSERVGTRGASAAVDEPRARVRQHSTRERLAREARPRPGTDVVRCGPRGKR